MVVDFTLALAAGTISVVLALLAISRVPRLTSAGSGEQGLQRQLQPLAFLFRKKKLIDATDPARQLLEVLPGGCDWQRLMGLLATRMPGQADRALGGLQQQDVVTVCEAMDGEGAPMRAIFEDLGQEVLRITLSDPQSENSGMIVDSLTFGVMEQEIELLRSTMDGSPMLAWRENEKGAVTWANSAYLQMAARQDGQGLSWPLPRLIELPTHDDPSSAVPQRTMVDDAGQTRWFECHAQDSADQVIAVALPADAAVKAERSLREFVQILTKTFADLPIGMAIFDRERQLQLFNPSLLDLTGLSASFLTARPTLYAFLDQLRDARMVPEPKDYRSWRDQMNTLEQSAASGHHVETWSLPGGQTYRVSGRPHPDGALAFLFEDITSEMTLTRRFRSEISMGKEVLDALDDAVAVFGGGGRMVAANMPYEALWGMSEGDNLNEHLAVWQRVAGDSPGLTSLVEALENPDFNNKLRASGALAGPSGQLLSWGMVPLTGGRVMVRFSAPQRLPKAKQQKDDGPGAETRVAHASGRSGSGGRSR